MNRANTNFRFLLPALLLVLTLPAPQPRAAEENERGQLRLAELARKAEFIALAQVRDTDYRLQREIPVSGSAYLRVLIPYKGDPAADIIEVYEKGLRERECYFPNPSVFEEGRRYLVFLQRDPVEQGRYRGLPEGCAVDVLVDRENRYAVRLPVTGLALSEPLEALAQVMQFADAYAVVDDADLSPALRDSMRAAGQIVPYEEASESPAPFTPGLSASPDRAPRRWRYTQGIGLSEFRELLRLDTRSQAGGRGG